MKPILSILILYWDLREQYNTNNKLVYEINYIDNKKFKSF